MVFLLGAICTLLLWVLVFGFSKSGDKEVNSKEFSLVFNQTVAAEKAKQRPKLVVSEAERAVLEQLSQAKNEEEEQEILQGASALVKRLFIYTHTGMDYFDFYGRVVDQFGDPVVGVNIQTSVGGGHLGGGSGSALTATDRDGYFIIKNKKGGSLQIQKMTKFGYDIDFIKQASAFIFTLSDQDRKYNKSIKDLDDYQNKKNAYIYRAWKITKETGKPDLHNDQGRFGLLGNKQWYTLDLLKHEEMRKIKGKGDGQIYVQFYRSNDSEIVWDNDWSFNLKVKGGGLIETDDLYMQRAPESGYISSWSMSKKDIPESLQRKNAYNRSFYLHIDNSFYARLNIEFRPYKRRGKYQGQIMINYSINKDGHPYLAPFKSFD